MDCTKRKESPTNSSSGQQSSTAPIESPHQPAGGTSSGKANSADPNQLQTVFGLQCFPRATNLSELDRYLREDPVGLEEDPMQWWQLHANTYPSLVPLAEKYLAIPLTCFLTSGKSGNRFAPIANQNQLLSPTLLNQLNQPRDGIGLPGIKDVLAQGRMRLTNQDQAVYHVLWHNYE